MKNIKQYKKGFNIDMYRSANKFKLSPINSNKTTYDIFTNIHSPIKIEHSKHVPSTVLEWRISTYRFNKNTNFKLLPVVSKDIHDLVKTYVNSKPKNSIKTKKVTAQNILINNPVIKDSINKTTLDWSIHNRQKSYYAKKIFNGSSWLVKRLLKLVKGLKRNNVYLKWMRKMGKNKRQKNKKNKITDIVISKSFNILVQNIAFFTNKFATHCVKKKISRENANINKVKSILQKTVANIPQNTFYFSPSCLSRGFMPNTVNTFNSISTSLNVKSDILHGAKKLYFAFLQLRVARLKNIKKQNKLQIHYVNQQKLNIKLLRKVYLFIQYFVRLYFYHLSYNSIYLLRLNNIATKLVGKMVSITITNAKYLYQDKQILGQAITNKLKDRKKRVLKVLKTIMGLIKKPYYKIHFYNKKLMLQEKDNVLRSNSFFLDPHMNITSDCLHDDIVNNKYIINKPFNFKPRLLLYNIKHKIISGIRLQGSGRLTRRLTASRSISKLKYMGTLQNIYSSFQGFSTYMMRGFRKASLQYININDHNRNGSFGVKVSVSSY